MTPVSQIKLTDHPDQGTVRLGERARSRALAPDIARGIGMAGVAVVNAVAYVTAADPVRTSLDTGVDFVATLLLEGRSWPMFALMFGFGVAAMAAGLERRGLSPRATRRVLRRRNWWLICFGLTQSVLFFGLDILGIYGVSAMVLLVILRRSTRTWWVVGVLALVPGILLDVLLALVDPAVGGAEEFESSAYLWSVLDRLLYFCAGTLYAGVCLALVPAMVIGLGYFRSGALRRPWDHTSLHRRVAVCGLATGILGGAPHAVIEAGGWVVSPTVAAAATTAHALTGIAQGAAYVSLVALWVARTGERPGVGARALAAVGQRSLSVYLLHAVLLAMTLAPWALDLATHLSLAATYAWGLGVWSVCALFALVQHAAGKPGPADVLLRHLTYRKVGPDSSPRVG